jgi:hypothetical protein
MKNTRRSILITLLLSGGIWFHSVKPAHSTAPAFSIQLPAQSLDLSDLDVRDGNNRRVTSVSEKNQLSSLFTDSLTAMILQNITPTKRVMNFILEQSWNGAFGWLGTAVKQISVLVVGWIAKNKWFHAAARVQRAQVRDVSERWRLAPASVNFHSLISSILSSTILLR